MLFLQIKGIVSKFTLTAEERRARIAFGWRPARGGSTIATASGQRLRMSGSKNSARPEGGSNILLRSGVDLIVEFQDE